MIFLLRLSSDGLLGCNITNSVSITMTANHSPAHRQASLEASVDLILAVFLTTAPRSSIDFPVFLQRTLTFILSSIRPRTLAATTKAAW
jgi:hypothetical protein